jgi:histidinol-phosphatase (PHP family)
MIIDLHVHSARCGHASGTPGEYVAAARAAGVELMAFTDHLPLPPRFDAGYAMPARELGDYVEDVPSSGGSPPRAGRRSS